MSVHILKKEVRVIITLFKDLTMCNALPGGRLVSG